MNTHYNQVDISLGLNLSFLGQIADSILFLYTWFDMNLLTETLVTSWKWVTHASDPWCDKAGDVIEPLSWGITNKNHMQ